MCSGAAGALDFLGSTDGEVEGPGALAAGVEEEEEDPVTLAVLAGLVVSACLAVSAALSEDVTVSAGAVLATLGEGVTDAVGAVVSVDVHSVCFTGWQEDTLGLTVLAGVAVFGAVAAGATVL